MMPALDCAVNDTQNACPEADSPGALQILGVGTLEVRTYIGNRSLIACG